MKFDCSIFRQLLHITFTAFCENVKSFPQRLEMQASLFISQITVFECLACSKVIHFTKMSALT